jgi:hypothetical protein
MSILVSAKYCLLICPEYCKSDTKARRERIQGKLPDTVQKDEQDKNARVQEKNWPVAG